MKRHFNTNNFIAILIALSLFAAGFTLWFIHDQSHFDLHQGSAGKTKSEAGP